MEIPKWNELFLPTLQAYANNQSLDNRAMKKLIADNLRLPESLRYELTPKHKENKIEGRIGWAISALKIAGLLKKNRTW